MNNNHWNRTINDLLEQNNFVPLQNKDQFAVRELSFENFSVSVNFHPDFKLSILSVISDYIGKDCYFCNYIHEPVNDIRSINETYFVLHIPISFFKNHCFVFESKHKKNLKANRVFDMLIIAKNFEQYLILSDELDGSLKKNQHFYMQIVNKGLLPIETDCKNDELLDEIYKRDSGFVGLMKNYLRGVIVLISENKQWLADVYFEIEKLIGRSYSLAKHPYLNIICWKDNEKWYLIIVPRVVRRPTQYYEQGKNKMNITPGAIEMGGVFFTAKQSDFKNLTKENVIDVYSQVTYGFNHLKELLLPLKQIITHG